MDIFPTLLSLANVTPPADRRYDGIDASNILLKGEKNGHEVLIALFWFITLIAPVSSILPCIFRFSFTLTAAQQEHLVTYKQYEWGGIKLST